MVTCKFFCYIFLICVIGLSRFFVEYTLFRINPDIQKLHGFRIPFFKRQNCITMKIVKQLNNKIKER